MSTSTRRSVIVTAALGAMLLGGAGPVHALDWNAEGVRDLGGTYSLDCGNPSAPRLRGVPGALMVEVGNKRLTGTNVQIALGYFGQQEPPPGDRTTVLLSQVRGQELIFFVHQDRSGQWVEVSGDPKVVAALGKGLTSQRFRDCDLQRSERAAAQAVADIRQARADSNAAATRAKAPTAVRFKTALTRALGPSAREAWIEPQYLEPTADAKRVTIAGTAYQMTSSCKPHDCFDNNIVVLYAANSGAVYGQLNSRSRLSQFGAPPPMVSTELQRLWRGEFRQGQ